LVLNFVVSAKAVIVTCVVAEADVDVVAYAAADVALDDADAAAIRSVVSC
jgi:hypothetical protein